MPTDQHEAPWPALQRASRTVVVVDVVESVRLMEQDEDDTIRRWQAFVGEVVTRLLPLHGGRLVKSLGDGLMLEFESVLPAIRCALAMQLAIEPHNLHRPGEQWMCLRVGAHVADVVVDERDIYGAGVNLAARLASDVARRGEVVVSAAVRDGLLPGVDADVEDLGPCHLKHMAQPVLAYRVAPLGAAPAAATAMPPLEAVKAGPLPFLAVLPLAPREVSAAQVAFGEVVADNLIVRLSSSEMVRVISRLSTSALQGRGETVERIGALLNAAFVFSGRYSVNGDRVEVLVELAAAPSQEVLWARRFERTLADACDAEGEFLELLCEGVLAAIAAHEVRRVKVHALPHLEGMSLQIAATSLMHRSSRSEFDRSREVLEHLVNRYPRAPVPRAWLAKWYVLCVTRGLVDSADAQTSRALDQTRRALDTAPECSLALAMEGFVRCHMLRDLSGAEALLDRALLLNPSESWAWLFKCVVQGFRGEGAPALESARRAIALSPLDPMRHYFDGLAASAALSAGDLALATEWATRSLRVSRDHLPTLRVLAIAQNESGASEDARATVGRVLALAPNFTIRSYLAQAPAGAETTRQRYAQALRDAGVPQG